MKRYVQNFRKIYQFAEFGDNENYFIELCYVCPRSEFKSELGAPLINKTAINGKPIFGAVNIELGKYRLLNERIEELEGDTASPLIKVFETYGYAPDTVYTTYSAEPVSIFGLQDPSGYLEVYATGHSSTYNPSNDTFTIYLTDNSQLVVGDVIKAQFIGSGQWYNCVGPSVAVMQVLANNVIITPAFQLTFIDRRGQVTTTISKQDTANVIALLNPTGYWNGTRKFVREVSTRNPSSVITNVYNIISFHTSFPQPDARFTVSLGNSETDTISALTIPSATTWKSYIASGTLINCQDSSVDTIFPKTFFKKTTKKVLAR